MKKTNFMFIVIVLSAMHFIVPMLQFYSIGLLTKVGFYDTAYKLTVPLYFINYDANSRDNEIYNDALYSAFIHLDEKKRNSSFINDDYAFGDLSKIDYKNSRLYLLKYYSSEIRTLYLGKELPGVTKYKDNSLNYVKQDIYGDLKWQKWLSNDREYFGNIELKSYFTVNIPNDPYEREITNEYCNSWEREYLNNIFLKEIFTGKYSCMKNCLIPFDFGKGTYDCIYMNDDGTVQIMINPSLIQETNGVFFNIG